MVFAYYAKNNCLLVSKATLKATAARAAEATTARALDCYFHSLPFGRPDGGSHRDFSNALNGFSELRRVLTRVSSALSDTRTTRATRTRTHTTMTRREYFVPGRGHTTRRHAAHKDTKLRYARWSSATGPQRRSRGTHIACRIDQSRAPDLPNTRFAPRQCT